ncbi:hypothetical protein F5Y13DRAFT_159358 [Hypoxylon sp. FL1857]|nr:hypothetical protein F5Y13DRAFT_159358 [Hypoxylon sp. FL1857]
MNPPALSGRFHRAANKRLQKKKALVEMQEDTTGADEAHPPDKQDVTKEAEDAKLAQVTRRPMRRRHLWGRVKDRLPDIVRTSTKESDPKTSDNESRRSSTTQGTDSKVTKQPSFSTRGKELLKKGLMKPNVKEILEEKKKGSGPDRLEQWFFKHSGGTLRDKY